MPNTPGIIGGPPKPEQADQNRPYSVQLRLNLTLLILHFKSSRNLPAIQSQLESSDRVLRRILSSTLRDPEVRYASRTLMCSAN